MVQPAIDIYEQYGPDAPEPGFYEEEVVYVSDEHLWQVIIIVGDDCYRGLPFEPDEESINEHLSKIRLAQSGRSGLTIDNEYGGYWSFPAAVMMGAICGLIPVEGVDED